MFRIDYKYFCDPSRFKYVPGEGNTDMSAAFDFGYMPYNSVTYPTEDAANKALVKIKEHSVPHFYEFRVTTDTAITV